MQVRQQKFYIFERSPHIYPSGSDHHDLYDQDSDNYDNENDDFDDDDDGGVGVDLVDQVVDDDDDNNDDDQMMMMIMMIQNDIKEDF